MDPIKSLTSIRDALCELHVHGKQDLQRLLGCITVMDQLIAEMHKMEGAEDGGGN